MEGRGGGILRTLGGLYLLWYSKQGKSQVHVWSVRRFAVNDRPGCHENEALGVDVALLILAQQLESEVKILLLWHSCEDFNVFFFKGAPSCPWCLGFFFPRLPSLLGQEDQRAASYKDRPPGLSASAQPLPFCRAVNSVFLPRHYKYTALLSAYPISAIVCSRPLLSLEVSLRENIPPFPLHVISRAAPQRATRNKSSLRSTERRF